MAQKKAVKKAAKKPAKQKAPKLPKVKGRLPPKLSMCPACKRHVFPGTGACPHCGANVASLAAKQADAMQRVLDSMKTLQALLEKSGTKKR